MSKISSQIRSGSRSWNSWLQTPHTSLSASSVEIEPLGADRGPSLKAPSQYNSEMSKQTLSYLPKEGLSSRSCWLMKGSGEILGERLHSHVMRYQ